ncbi:substrate-binding domain-containing protein [Corynebacterium hindlerae]|uniref:Substrate-binding domain-containing protein n=1 Tax=Corynebacterium hindlerae TaxID=699041 RepID=A0A7G5FF33_9CORY|nr:substrate-binding domain-containing protein [Corynebacterium hindlerae]
MVLRMKALVAALCALALVACGGDIPQSVKPNSNEKLVIVAATELRDMGPLIQRASADLGFEIEMQYPDGTIANSVSLKEGAFDGGFDATWFATNKYIDLYGADTKQGPSTSVATSPIAFGVHAAKARELGWTNKQPTWDDITTAVKEGKFSYGMTDPARSNSGFSALVSVATANADTGAALQLTDMPGLQEPLQSFFEGQKMTAGSSGWLEDSFVSDPGHVDAIINYESVLLQMKKQGSTDIEVVVPADRVVTADYPLAPLAQPRSPAARKQRSRPRAWWNGLKNTTRTLSPTPCDAPRTRQCSCYRNIRKTTSSSCHFRHGSQWRKTCWTPSKMSCERQDGPCSCLTSPGPWKGIGWQVCTVSCKISLRALQKLRPVPLGSTTANASLSSDSIARLISRSLPNSAKTTPPRAKS